MPQETLSLMIAPRRRILRDFRGNMHAILVALAVLGVWIMGSAALISRFEHWPFLHAAYFTVINVTTVGFGDVTAQTHNGKLLSGVNSFVGLVLFGVIVALVTLAFQPGEFSGTASFSSASPTAPQASATADAPPGTTQAVASLLRSLGDVLGTSPHMPDSRVHLVVRKYDLGRHRIIIEIAERGSHPDESNTQ